MSQKRITMVGLAALAALIVFGCLVVSGFAVYRSGQSQGYMMGRLSASGDDGAIAPYAPYLPISQSTNLSTFQPNEICIFEPFVVQRYPTEQGMNETILVVDDEPKIVKLARDYLERSGFRVVTAADGTTALAVARHERPDLIVLDLNLPGMDGLDVCRAGRMCRSLAGQGADWGWPSLRPGSVQAPGSWCPVPGRCRPTAVESASRVSQGRAQRSPSSCRRAGITNDTR